MKECFGAEDRGQGVEAGSVKAGGLGGGSRTRAAHPTSANCQSANHDAQLKHTRRQLITRVLRNASLALLGAGGGAAVVKRRRLLREGKCLNQGICRDCTVFDECGLPRALSTRSVSARTRYDE